MMRIFSRLRHNIVVFWLAQLLVTWVIAININSFVNHLRIIGGCINVAQDIVGEGDLLAIELAILARQLLN